MKDAEAAVSTVRLTRDFGSFRAVDGVNLDIPRGAIFGFLGLNGSGKTTTIRMLLPRRRTSSRVMFFTGSSLAPSPLSAAKAVKSCLPMMHAAALRMATTSTRRFSRE